MLARLVGGGPWSSADLVDIVGRGWAERPSPAQSEALGHLLARVLGPEGEVVLGEIWETALSQLGSAPVPLARETAEALVAAWRGAARRRAEEWHRPRRYRAKAGRTSEFRTVDLSGTLG